MAYTLTIQPEPGTPLSAPSDVAIVVSGDASYYVRVKYADIEQQFDTPVSNVIVRIGRTCQLRVQVLDVAYNVVETRILDYVVLSVQPVLDIVEYSTAAEFVGDTSVIFRCNRPGSLTYKLLRPSGTEFFASSPMLVTDVTSDGYVSDGVTVNASCTLVATFLSDQNVVAVEAYRFTKLKDISEAQVLNSSALNDAFINADTRGWIVKNGSLQAGYLEELAADAGKYPARNSRCVTASGMCCVEGTVRFRAVLHNMEAALSSCLLVSINGIIQASYCTAGGHWFEAQVPAGPFQIALSYVSGWSAAVTDDFVCLEAIKLPTLVSYTALPQLGLTDSAKTSEAINTRSYVDSTAIKVQLTENAGMPVVMTKNADGYYGNTQSVDAAKTVRLRVFNAQGRLMTSRLSRYVVEVNSEIESTAFYPENTSETWAKGLTHFRWYVPPYIVAEEQSWRLVDGKLRSPTSGYGSSVLWAPPIYGADGTLTLIYNVVLDTSMGPFKDRAWLQHNSGSDLGDLDLSTAGQKTLTLSKSAGMTRLKLIYCRSPYSNPSQYIEIVSLSVPFLPRVGLVGYAMSAIEDWTQGFTSMPWVVNGDWRLPTPSTDMALSKGSIGASQSAYIEFTLDCLAGDISFIWGISSEANYDSGKFYVDGTYITGISGKVDYTSYTHTVTAGLHTFKFGYTKDDSVDANLDTFFIKRIDFPVAGAVPFMTTFDQYPYTRSGTVTTAWNISVAPIINSMGAAVTVVTGQTATLELTRAVAEGYLYIYYSIVHYSAAYPTPYVLEYYLDNVYQGSVAQGNGSRAFFVTAGTHKLTLKASGGYAEGSLVGITSVRFPIAKESILYATPAQGKVTFPRTVALTTPLSEATIRYTLDGTEPTADNGNDYASPIELVGPALLKASLMNPTSQGVASFTYLDAAVSDAHQETTFLRNSTSTRYALGEPVALPTYPENLPVYYTSSLDDHTTQKLYAGEPLVFAVSQNLRIYKPKLKPNQMGGFLYNQQPLIDELYDNPLYLAYGSIPDEIEGAVEKILISQLFACSKEIDSYKPVVIPSIASGTYKQTIQVDLRCNLPETEILYTTDGSDPTFGTIYAGESVTVTSELVLRCLASLPPLAPGMFRFEYFVDPDLAETQTIALLKTTAVNRNGYGQIDRTANVSREFSYGVLRAGTNMSELTDALEQTSYSRYCEYVRENNIPALFADEAMSQPFPFAFSVRVSLGSTISLPDENGVIYRDQERITGFTQDGLVCQFDAPIGSDTSVRIVSDFCLRLCLDVEQDSPEDCILQVWTNLPAGTYLMSSSPAVLLSNDGKLFSRHIQLQRTDLYLKGHIDGPTYGNNLFDVNIDLFSSEVYSVS